MKRLADLFQFVPRAPWRLGWINESKTDTQYEDTKAKLKKIPIFVIDNIAEYLFSNAKPKDGSLPDEIELIIAPPFDEFWIEYNLSKEHVEACETDWVLHGFHCYVTPLSSSNDSKQWEIKLIGYQSIEKAVIGPIAQLVGIIGENAPGYFDYKTLVRLIDIPDFRFFGEEWVRFFNPCLIALHFVSCPIVEVKEVNPPKRFLGNKAFKRGERQPVKYKVLDIDSLKVLLKTEGKIDQVGISQALTTVRGHWRTYTPEKPLFGKYIGKFFIKDYSKGSKEAGEIKKGYNVKSPVIPD